MPDASTLARAHQAMAAGDPATALSLAEGLVARHPADPGVRQLASVAARRLGRLDAARDHLEAALGSTPGDPNILNSYANLLLEMGETAQAREVYEASLLSRPDQPETMVNLALACRRLDDGEAAEAALRRVLDRTPGHVRALQMLGLVQMDAGEAAAAARSFDAAIQRAPQDARLAAARAQAESELGGDAAPFYARARSLAPQDPELVRSHALALARAGATAEAEALLEALIAALPDFADAHASLARLRWQNGQPERFTESFEQALAVQPTHAGLWMGLFGLLLRSGQPQAALDRLAAATPALGEATVRGLEAAAATEAGDLARADAAFADLDPATDSGLRIAWLRQQLRAGRPEAVVRFVGQERGGPTDDDWPYLSLAWRLTDDPRADWLERDPAFVRAFDLPLTGTEMDGLAEVLRGLHNSRAAPFDQSLRGGTQTEGSLFGRAEPEIRRLVAALRDAIAEYVAGLPAADPTHPLLRAPRGRFRFAGSWSVRLTGGGFHENHVHTTGWLSSAFYVAVPQDLPGTAGWLALGAPPVELGLDLQPFQRIEPRPGRLALFPSTMWHGTEPFPAGERMTTAFDVKPVRRAGR